MRTPRKARFVSVLLLAFGLSFAGCARKNPYSGTIIDEIGRPVAGANITLRWDARIPVFLEPFDPHYQGDNRVLSLTSDSDGGFSFRAAGLVVFGSIQKPGYHDTAVVFHPGKPTQNGATPIPLLRIINRQPMVGKKVKILLPVGSSLLQYDLLKGDCLPPFGTGLVADLQIEWKRPVEINAEACRRAFKSQFLGEGNGVILHRTIVDPLFARSRLRSAHEAPNDGYQPQCDFGDHFRGGDIVAYLKIRSGQPGGPLFGKMLGPISYWAAKDRDRFEFEYVMNPTGDRGLEIDMHRITVPTRHELEYAPAEF